MSYILEALKQSEYARQQGKVPTLNTLPPMIQPPVELPAHRALPYRLLTGVLLVLATVLAWWHPWPAPAGQQQSSAISQVPPAPAAQPVPLPVPSATATMAEPAPPAAPIPTQPAVAPSMPPICHSARPAGC